jgi:hypothetical protein
MPVFLILFGVFLLTVFFVIRRKSAAQRLRMSLWLTVAYSFLLLVHLFSGMNYRAGNLWHILPYVLCCLLLMVLGEQAGARLKITGNIKKIRVTNKQIALAAIAGACMLVYDLLRLNDVTLGLRTADQQISIIGVMGNALAGFGVIPWLLGLGGFVARGVKIPLWSYCSFLAYGVVSVVTAGRQALFLLLLSSLIMVVWGAAKRKELNIYFRFTRKKIMGLAVLASLFVGYFIFLSNTRTQIMNIDNKMNIYGNAVNAKFSAPTRKMVHAMGALDDIYAEALMYYSHELRRLDLIYRYYDYSPQCGLSQLHYVERRLRWLLGDDFADKAWAAQEKALEPFSFSSLTWGTFITGFIVDFGRVGALVACFVSGLLFGVCYRKLKNEETASRVVQHCIMLAGVLFSVQYSPFAEMCFTFPVVALFFISIKQNKVRNETNT